jgi:hypothetical protein
MDMSAGGKGPIKTPVGPPSGAFTAALFEAYKGECDCLVCKILREEVRKTVQEFVPKDQAQRSGGRG